MVSARHPVARCCSERGHLAACPELVFVGVRNAYRQLCFLASYKLYAHLLGCRAFAALVGYGELHIVVAVLREHECRVRLGRSLGLRARHLPKISVGVGALVHHLHLRAFEGDELAVHKVEITVEREHGSRLCLSLGRCNGEEVDARLACVCVLAAECEREAVVAVFLRRVLHGVLCPSLVGVAREREQRCMELGVLLVAYGEAEVAGVSVVEVARHVKVERRGVLYACLHVEVRRIDAVVALHAALGCYEIVGAVGSLEVVGVGSYKGRRTRCEPSLRHVGGAVVVLILVVERLRVGQFANHLVGVAWVDGAAARLVARNLKVVECYVARVVELTGYVYRESIFAVGFGGESVCLLCPLAEDGLAGLAYERCCSLAGLVGTHV